MNRPPPYFPQNQLSPPSDKRYRRFKLMIGLAIVALVAFVIGVGIGIVYLVRWIF